MGGPRTKRWDGQSFEGAAGICCFKEVRGSPAPVSFPGSNGCVEGVAPNNKVGCGSVRDAVGQAKPEREPFRCAWGCPSEIDAHVPHLDVVAVDAVLAAANVHAVSIRCPPSNLSPSQMCKSKHK